MTTMPTERQHADRALLFAKSANDAADYADMLIESATVSFKGGQAPYARYELKKALEEAKRGYIEGGYAVKHYRAARRSTDPETIKTNLDAGFEIKMAGARLDRIRRVVDQLRKEWRRKRK